MTIQEAVFEDLEGQVLAKITGKAGDETMLFETNQGAKYRLYSKENGHGNHMCVEIDDISGDFKDIIGAPIDRAEKVTNIKSGPRKDEDSFTWTLYKLDTIKGGVTIRWYGYSNKNYSEKVDFELISSASGSAMGGGRLLVRDKHFPINELKLGRMAFRKCWPRSRHIQIQKPYEGTDATEPYIVLFKGEIISPWNPSQEEILAEDWETLEGHL